MASNRVWSAPGYDLFINQVCSFLSSVVQPCGKADWFSAGEGIMKTQPTYALRSENCHHFVSVYLPRILCANHKYLPHPPKASIRRLGKITTFPLYEVGVKAGELAVVEHRYLGDAVLGFIVINIVSWLKGKELQNRTSPLDAQ